MLRLTHEMALENREKMRDGEGVVTIKHLFQEGDLQGKVRLTAKITLPVGASIGFHRHDQEEEIFYVVSGQGRFNDDGDWKTIQPGDAMVTGGGKGHSVANDGSQPLVLLAVILLY